MSLNYTGYFKPEACSALSYRCVVNCHCFFSLKTDIENNHFLYFLALETVTVWDSFYSFFS